MTLELQSQNILDESDPESLLDLQLDDIKLKFHPSSNRATIITHFQDFTRARAKLDIVPEDNPYKPFPSRLDFEFSKIALEAGLNAGHADSLIKLMRSVSDSNEFTLVSHGNMMNIWKKASDILTAVWQNLYYLL